MLKIELISDQVDAYALRDMADYVIKPRLISLPGVAQVDVFGGKVRQIQIQPDPEKLAAYGFSVADIVAAAPGSLALKGAGFIDLHGQRVLIQTPTPSPDSSVIGDGVLGVRGTTPIRLRDVATIAEEPAQRVGDALIQGRAGVLLSVSSQYGANTLATTQAVEQVLTGLTTSMRAQGIALYPALHQPATFIERSLHGLERSMAIAAVLILLTLYLFLRDWRSALISFVSIPLSLLAAIAVLNAFGYTLNTMTLSGFIVALGVLVDDAVIGIENILRRLRENSQEKTPRPARASSARRRSRFTDPVFYATLVVLAVFVPELLSSDVQGRFIGPLALAFMLAVGASLLVALTTTPALSAILLFPQDAHVDPWWIRLLKRLQAAAIGLLYEHVYVGIAIVAAVFVVCVGVVPFLSSSFLPEFREGHLVVQVTSKLPGTSIDEMLALGQRISGEVMALPYVSTIEQQVGRSENTEDTWGPHQSEFQDRIADGRPGRPGAGRSRHSRHSRALSRYSEFGRDVSRRSHQPEPDRADVAGCDQDLRRRSHFARYNCRAHRRCVAAGARHRNLQFKKRAARRCWPSRSIQRLSPPPVSRARTCSTRSPRIMRARMSAKPMPDRAPSTSWFNCRNRGGICRSI